MKTGLPRNVSVSYADPERCQVKGSDRSGVSRCDHGYAGPMPRGLEHATASVVGRAGGLTVRVEVEVGNSRYKPRLGMLGYDMPARRIVIGLYSDYRKDGPGADSSAKVVTLEKKLETSMDHRGWELRIVDGRGNVLAGLPPLTKR